MTFSSGMKQRKSKSEVALWQLRIAAEAVTKGYHLGCLLFTLEIFFGLYLPEISDYEKAYLNKALRELYAKYGIPLQPFR